MSYPYRYILTPKVATRPPFCEQPLAGSHDAHGVLSDWLLFCYDWRERVEWRVLPLLGRAADHLCVGLLYGFRWRCGTNEVRISGCGT